MSMVALTCVVACSSNEPRHIVKPQRASVRTSVNRTIHVHVEVEVEVEGKVR